MLHAFSTPRDRVRTLVFFVACSALAIAAALGISDNPPGILCAFPAAAAFVLAFVHPWRTPRQFLRLAGMSVAGLVAFGVVHNAFEALAGRWAESGLVHGLLTGIGVASFLIAVLLCPPAMVVGAIGALVTALRNRHRPPSDAAVAAS